jgi:uncharacterized surface protein with fasciclin (FAS1) repeats
MKTTNRRKLAALVFPFALIVAACGSDDNGAADDTTDPVETTAPATDDDNGDMETDTTEEMNGDDMEAGMPEGPACAAVPEDGDGSFDGMAQDPVGTAASNNPELSTTVDALTAAGLVDTLNDGSAEFTVFAPINSAYEEIPEEDLNALLEEPEGALTDILTFHVIPERIEPEDLSGSYETVNGAEVTVEGEAPEFDVNGQATVGCAGVQTSNATVYLIDSVLMPEG